MTRIFCALTLATSISLGNLAFAQHRLVTQGNNVLAIVDAKGAVEWEMPWGGIHDIHVLANGDIMVQQGPASVVQIDPTTKTIVWRYDARTTNREQGHENDPVEIHAFQPLDDAGQQIMIAESGPARIIEVNRLGQLLSETKLTVDHPHPHTDTRLARKIAPNRYLVCHEADGTVREYEEGTGRVVWEYELPLFGKEERGGNDFDSFGRKCFGAVRLKNGNTLIATGNGHSVLEVTPEKKIVWKLSQDDLAPTRLAWVSTLEVLENGNYVIGNCHAGPGQPLIIEIDPQSKTVVWQFDQFERFGNSVPNSQLLDTKGANR